MMRLYSWYNRPGLRWLRIFHLELIRKTDILALAAFFISVGGLFYQIVQFIKKPEIVHFPPDQIVFYFEENNDVKYLQVGAQSCYVNRGKGEKNAVLRRERLLFDLGGKSYELKWQDFLHYGSEGKELTKKDVQPAIPTVIKAGDGISHETHFAPRSSQSLPRTEGGQIFSYLLWDQFVSEMNKTNELDLRIVADFYDLPSTETHFYMEVNETVRYSLKNLHWDAPSVWPREGAPPSPQSSTPASPQPAISQSTPSPTSPP
jgi:hypothetical protein